MSKWLWFGLLAVICLIPTAMMIYRCWQGLGILYRVPTILLCYLAAQVVMLAVLIWAFRFNRRD